MKHRMTWAAALASVTVGLTGCPMALTTLDQDTFLGLPTSQRTSAGDRLPGTTPTSSGGGTSGGSTSGGSGGTTQPGTGGTFGESGSNPSQVSLESESSLRVDPLYPSGTQAMVTISNAPRGMLAAAGVVNLSGSQPVQPNLSVSWPTTSNLLAFGPRLMTAGNETLSGEDAFKQSLRQRLGSDIRQSSRSVQSVRALIDSPSPSVMILSGSSSQERSIWIYEPVTASIGGRTTKFAIAVDTTDKAAVFDGSQGTALKSTLETIIRTQILPALQATYGPVPSRSEAQAEGIQFRDDVTYFIFSSQLQDNLLGYFNPGDFFPGQNSNQIKALYLSADAAIDARSDTVARNDLMGTIAHELQHLLFAWNRVEAVGSDGYLAEAQGGADVWIDEGLAMLATVKAGFGLEAKPGQEASYIGPSLNLAGHVKQFLARPGDYSMVAFHQNATLSGETGSGNPSAAYGVSYLFSQYMVDQLGDAVVGDILSSTQNGLTIGSGGILGKHDPLGIVNDALGKRGTKLSTLLANFAAAVALDGTSALSSSDATMKQRYDIQNLNLRKSPFAGLSLTGPAFSGTGSAPPRPFGIRLMDPGALGTSSTLQLSGNSSVATRLILHR